MATPGDTHELQTMIRDSAARVLGDGVTPAVRESGAGGEWCRELWALAVDVGLDTVLIQDDSIPLSIARSVVRAAGEFAAPLPLPEAVLSRWLIGRAGMEQPEGVLTLAPAFTGGTGTARRVPWGRYADWVVAIDEAEPDRVLLHPGSRFQWTTGANLAGEPRDDGLLKDPGPARAGTLSGALDCLRFAGALLRATQTAGAAATLVRMCSEHAESREQFGRVLGRFQVIQHQLARLAEAAAAADAVTAAAWRSLDSLNPVGRAGRSFHRDARLLMAAAKASAGSRVETITGVAHQIHGAMGFTAEFPLHHFTRRLWSWRAEFGTPAEWHERLGTLALQRGGLRLWDDVTTVMDA